MKLKLLNSILSVSLAYSLLLTGCANSNAYSDAAQAATTPIVTEIATTESEAIYPISIKHAFGETVIQTKPERVATIAWGNHDLPLALGVIPVGISKANYGVIDESGMLPWTAAKFKELGVDTPILFDDVAGLNFEAIADVQPDVILAAYSGITKEEYDLLSEIAPVVAYPSLPWQTFWRDQIIYDATGMGMQTEGEALIQELEQLITAKTSEYPQIQGKTAAFFYFNPADLGNFYVYLPNDPRAAYLLDLGMAVPESVSELAKEATSFAVPLSSENADLLYDIDMIITYGNDALLTALQADPLLGTIPAVKRGSVALIEDGTPLAASGTPSALSIPATIDEYLKVLGEAVNKVE
ncbi:iron-siderophore ABC transporter substrate-binding protein [Cellulosilyticum sp. I15G10I2]|uniref:iron-siderophore ABC transporter substrate-binding protein n=1 Tax=Cellulosilyticum sp. I15G10I2 TaxID=1892843 RepID=UPI00085CD922|nr:iron-siderophore ABC transporter substrate-binding protein [Cellulosilyticum sp. I15G10I2]